LADPIAPKDLALLLSEIRPSRLTTIVDVGANPVHEPPYHLLRDVGACHVIGFEPEAEAFARLETARRPNETNFNLTVGDGKPHRLHLYRQQSMTSIFPPYKAGLRALGWDSIGKVRDSVETPTVALDRLAGMPPFDLMKIDIQGGETLAFRGARKLLMSAVAVIVELRYHRLYEDEPMLSGVDTELEQLGFGLHKFLFNKSRMFRHSQVDRVRRRAMSDQLVDGDAVYLRSVSEPETLSDDQLKHLAILGNSVFQSHSLVLYCLDMLVTRGCAPADLPARYVDALPDRYRKEEITPS
jgi:FkbM family methyltransferase